MLNNLAVNYCKSFGNRIAVIDNVVPAPPDIVPSPLIVTSLRLVFCYIEKLMSMMYRNSLQIARI